jgi:hypothetical protein
LIKILQSEFAVDGLVAAMANEWRRALHECATHKLLQAFSKGTYSDYPMG